MRASARVAWRVAAAIAFVSTATLAVTLTQGAPLQTALTSARNTGHGGAAAVAHQHRPGLACRSSGLRIWVSDGADATPPASGAAVEFTNTSGAACTMSGYPQVAASWADGAQVGNAASRDTSASVRRIVLTPGATAHAVLAEDVSGFPGGSCKPVTAAGLRVVPPGQSIARYVRHAVTACSAAGLREPVFLHVRALQVGVSDADRSW
jgi:uncharacterized protein DUF4232